MENQKLATPISASPPCRVNDKELGRAGYRFRLKAGNGGIIATSEGYTSKAGAKNGIESVKKNTADAEVVDLS